MELPRLSIGVLAAFPSHRFRRLSSLMEPGDELLFIEPAEAHATDRANPLWLERAHNYWGLMLYAYEELNEFTLWQLRSAAATHEPSRLMPLCDVPSAGRRVQRPEVRLVHQHAPAVKQSVLADIHFCVQDLEDSEIRDIGPARLAMTLEWLELDPDNPTAWLNAAGLYESFGRDERCLAAARHALNRALGTEAVDATQLLARAMLRLGQFNQVLEVVRVQHALGNQSVESLHAAAIAHLKLGNAPAALLFANESVRRHAEPFLSVDPDIARVARFVLRAEVLAHMGQHDAALEQLLALPDGAIARADAGYVLALVLTRLGRAEEARQALEPSLAWGPTVEGLRLAAALALEAEDFESSVQWYEQAWDAGAHDFELFVKWILAAEKLGDIPRIETAFRKYSEVADVTVPMLLEWGKGFSESGEQTRAESCLTEALRRAPDNADTYFALAELLVRSGNNGDAAHLYECGLRIRPADSRAWRMHAACLQELGLDRAAEISLSQADRWDPARVDATLTP